MMIVTWRHGGGPKIPIAIENKFVEKERKKTNFIDIQENIDVSIIVSSILKNCVQTMRFERLSDSSKSAQSNFI